MRSITLQSPAKINLGLAITGRRADGFHDLVTIFQAIDLEDSLTIAVPAGRADYGHLAFRCDSAAIDPNDNLVTRAVGAIRAVSGTATPLDITLTKRIPVAAGLGGASSNAAATLLGINHLLDLNLPPTTLSTLALGLGSDVPFFFSQGCALASGRGERLQSIRCTEAWFVVVFPNDAGLPRNKTPALFAALTPGDFSDGFKIVAQADRLNKGLPLAPALLENAFERAVGNLAPSVEEIRGTLLAAGAPSVALSGAGPSLYVVAANQAEARSLAAAYESKQTNSSSVFVCRARSLSTFGHLIATRDRLDI